MKQFSFLTVILLFLCANFSVAQNVSANDTVNIIYGALNYQGQTILITNHGIQIDKKQSINYSNSRNTNEMFSEYYKKIYGKDTENPNFVIDGGNLEFVPLININELYGNNHQIINGISVSELAKTFTDKNYAKRDEVLTKLKSYLSNKITINK